MPDSGQEPYKGKLYVRIREGAACNDLPHRDSTATFVVLATKFPGDRRATKKIGHGP